MPLRPGLANIAAVMADPAREAILIALASGRALPAGELADAAGISPQSASRHLQKLVGGGLLDVWVQGRFRYYRLASADVAEMLETMSAVAHHTTVRTGRTRKASPHFCEARRCYNHLAGRLGVAFAQAFERRGFVTLNFGSRDAKITEAGRHWLARTGAHLPQADTFRLCLDWSERRPHFAGTVATALLKHFEARRFLVPDAKEGRTLHLTPAGRRWFGQLGIDIAGEVARK